jgi:hypothetical protein
MALFTEIAAKSSEPEAPGEIVLPSLESASAVCEAPGLPGWLSRPDVTLKLCVATLALGAATLFFSPLAFPTRKLSSPPPLPPRGDARRPPRLPPTPLPAWMREPAPTHRPAPAARAVWLRHAASPAAPAPAASHALAAARTQPNTQHPTPAAPQAPLRIAEPGGAVCVVSRQWVALNGERVPADWAREVRRLFAPPPPPEPPEERPALRLLSPDSADAAVVAPPIRLRWSPVPGVQQYVLTLELLTHAGEETWRAINGLFAVPVTSTEFSLPDDMEWSPNGHYRWRVETSDGQSVAVGRFRLLTEPQRARLQAARGAMGHSRLMRAAIYRSFGFYGYALTELRALRAANPARPELLRAVRNAEADVHRHRAASTE